MCGGSRRRFWKSEADADKLAAQHTLYTCLVTLSKLCAPLIPFTAEALYQNLVRSIDSAAPESVHLADWPVADESVIDQQLEADTALVMRLASLGRAARSKAQIKVRQPVGRLLVRTRDAHEAEALQRLKPQLLDELNLKQLELLSDDASFLSYEVRPNLPRLGPRFGREVGSIAKVLSEMDARTLADAAQRGEAIFIGGHDLNPEDLLITEKEAPGFAVVREAGYIAALDTALTPELEDEGLVRELTHRVQSLRRDAGFEIVDRIVTYIEGDDEVQRVLREFRDFVSAETLSRELISGRGGPDAYSETQQIDGRQVTLGVQRVSS